MSTPSTPPPAPAPRAQRKEALLLASQAHRLQARACLDQLAARADAIESGLLRARAALLSPAGLAGAGLLAWLLLRRPKGRPGGGSPGGGTGRRGGGIGRWLGWAWEAWRAWQAFRPHRARN